MIDLSNRVVVVTGAAGHLGRAVVSRLRAAGARCVLLNRSPLPDAEGADSILALSGLDLTDDAAVRAALGEAKSRMGRLDALVATAGGYEGGTPVHEQDWAAWERMLTKNLKTAVVTCAAVIPHLVEQGGRIVTVGARPGLAGVGGMAPYSAAKSAVIRLTESLADELRDRNITVNCVVPSIIDTPENRAAMPKAKFARWVRAEDIAEVILFLLSDAARSVSGATIPVYGRS